MVSTPDGRQSKDFKTMELRWKNNEARVAQALMNCDGNIAKNKAKARTKGEDFVEMGQLWNVGRVSEKKN